jgi:glycine cleavage system H protein
VAEVNEAVAQSPELVNQSPYQEGWLVTVTVDGEVPADGLLDAAEYRDLTE